MSIFDNNIYGDYDNYYTHYDAVETPQIYAEEETIDIKDSLSKLKELGVDFDDIGITSVSDMLDAFDNGAIQDYITTQEAYPMGRWTPPEPAGAPGGNAGLTVFQKNLVSAMQSLDGAPYRYGGNDPKSGIDCSRSMQLALLQCGIQNAPRSTTEFLDYGTSVNDLDNAQIGDLIITDSETSRSGLHIEMLTNIKTDENGNKTYYTSGAYNTKVGTVFNQKFTRQNKIKSIRRVTQKPIGRHGIKLDFLHQPVSSDGTSIFYPHNPLKLFIANGKK